MGVFLQRRQQIQAVSNKEQAEDLEGFFNFVARVSTVMGVDFAPFLPHVLPLVLQAAQADLSIDVSESMPDAEQAFHSDNVTGEATAVASVRGVVRSCLFFALCWPTSTLFKVN